MMAMTWIMPDRHQFTKKLQRFVPEDEPGFVGAEMSIGLPAAMSTGPALNRVDGTEQKADDAFMNKRITAAVVTAVLLTSTFSRAGDPSNHFEAVAADVVIARPLWFAATVVGAGLFIVALPVAAMSKSVQKTAKTLVETPAHATFTRALGDFSAIE
jgi:uncharacterized MAPEG superfamily protein